MRAVQMELEMLAVVAVEPVVQVEHRVPLMEAMAEPELQVQSRDRSFVTAVVVAVLQIHSQ